MRNVLEFLIIPTHFWKTSPFLINYIRKRGREFQMHHGVRYSHLGHKKVKDIMSNVHVETTIGFQESEVPRTAEINPFGNFQAEVDGDT